MEKIPFHSSDQGAQLDGGYREMSVKQSYEKAKNALIFGVLFLIAAGVGCKIFEPELWNSIFGQ